MGRNRSQPSPSQPSTAAPAAEKAPESSSAVQSDVEAAIDSAPPIATQAEMLASTPEESERDAILREREEHLARQAAEAADRAAAEAAAAEAAEEAAYVAPVPSEETLQPFRDALARDAESDEPEVTVIEATAWDPACAAKRMHRSRCVCTGDARKPFKHQALPGT